MGMPDTTRKVMERRVADSRAVLAEADATDLTNPDIDTGALRRLAVRLTETLRAQTAHADRAIKLADGLYTDNARLADETRRLQRELDELKEG